MLLSLCVRVCVCAVVLIYFSCDGMLVIKNMFSASYARCYIFVHHTLIFSRVNATPPNYEIYATNYIFI